MKNIFALIAPLTILLSGCIQEELQNDQPEVLEGRVFTASFEQNETRTYVEEGNLLRWNEGDQISLFDGNTLNSQYQFDGETGDNSGTFSIVNAPYGSGNKLTANYAIYPYASDVKMTENGVLSFTLSSKQNYAVNSFGLGANTMVAVTKDTDDTFLKFRNVCGYLKLQLYGANINVKSIVLTGNDNEKLAGKVTITSNYTQQPTATMASDAGTSLILDCGDGIKLGANAANATAFWITIPPTIFKSGFTVTIIDVNGKAFTKSTSKEISIERNLIQPMKAFEVEIESNPIPDNQIWYTATDKIEPDMSHGFGANIVSNEWDSLTGKGVITFDGTVTKFGERVFNNQESLTSITIPNGVNRIYPSSFFNCTSLDRVNISSIESWCNIYFEPSIIANWPWTNPLYYAKKLYLNGELITDLIIPDGVKRIPNNAFHGCTNIRSVTIGKDVEYIGSRAFSECSNLTSLIIPDTDHIISLVDNMCALCTNLNSVTWGNNITSIPLFAFYGCSNLENIIIPETVTEIDKYAFDECSKLRKIFCKPTTPPAILKSFPFNENLTIYVPEESYDDYMKGSWNVADPYELDQANWYSYESYIQPYNFSDIKQ